MKNYILFTCLPRAINLGIHPLNVFIQFYSTNVTNSTIIISVKLYSNADTLKLQVLKDNKSLSGIYRRVNLVNGKSYIGSAVNLSNRLRQHYNNVKSSI